MVKDTGDKKQGGETRKFHSRSFVSFLVMVSFITMGITGLVMYIVPHGRIAYWVDWHMLGMTKDQWGNIHVLSSYLFLFSGGFHVYYNWKPFINYIVKKATGGLNRSRELALSVIVILLFIVSAIAELPPLFYISQLGSSIKDSWVSSPEYEPPFGHAELLSLTSFSKKMDLDADKAKESLEAAGIKVKDTSETLDAIAKANGVSPMKLFEIISKNATPATTKEEKNEETTESSSGLTDEQVLDMFEGKGIGRKTLAEISKEAGVDIETAKKNLAAAGITMEDNDTFKDVAEKSGTVPIDIALKAFVGK